MAAVIPVDQQIVSVVVPALTGTGDTVQPTDRPEGAKVLAFPAAVDRLNRSGNGRAKGRPKGRTKS